MPLEDLPTEQLKISGAEPLDSDKEVYDVVLNLSRELTPSEVAALEETRGQETPVGRIYQTGNPKKLRIQDTTIDLVAEHKAALVSAVAQVEENGAKLRQRDVDAAEAALRRSQELADERQRRRDMARGITFGD